LLPFGAFAIAIIYQKLTEAQHRADFAGEAANAANRTTLSKPAQVDDAAGAGDSVEAAVSFP